MREHLSLELNRDGGVESLALKGDLDLRISEPSKTVLVIALPPPSSYNKANDLQFKTHPNVDKNAWAQRGEIRLKEGKKGFPVGQGLGVLKWRMTGTDESVVPLSSAFGLILQIAPDRAELPSLFSTSQLLALIRQRHLHRQSRI